MTSTSHWTNRSPEDFLYSIASDFIEDLKERMRSLGMSQTKLARAAKVNKSYVSRIFKDPGNLSLETIVKLARTVGMKVSIVPYEDPNDPNNERGPIGSDIFRACWEDTGTPADWWALNERRKARADTLFTTALQEHLEWSRFVFNQTSNAPAGNVTGRVAQFVYRPIPGKKRTQSVLEVANA